MADASLASCGTKPCAACGALAAKLHYCLECRPFVLLIQKDVRVAIGPGPIRPKERCVDCGRWASYREHRHYSRPLDVVWVCRTCNIKRGPALDIAEMVAAYKQRSKQEAVDPPPTPPPRMYRTTNPRKLRELA